MAPFPAPKSSLRLRLGLLVAGTLLPLILFATGVVYLNHMRAREAAFDRVMEVVRGMRLVLDTEMQGLTLALEVLAGTQALQRGDMDGFRKNAAAFLRKYPGQAISLATRDGRQLLNTGLPPGETPPPRQNRDSIERVFSTGKPAYSDLFIGSVTRSHIVTISVPVFRDDQVIYETELQCAARPVPAHHHPAAAERRLDHVDLRPQRRQFRPRAQSGADGRTGRVVHAAAGAAVAATSKASSTPSRGKAWRSTPPSPARR